MLLKILVAFALGPWGMKILDFYIVNQAIINSIVFIYGVFLVTAHLNYKKISDQVFIQLSELSEISSKRKSVDIDINKTIEEKKMFPFVAGQISLFPKKTTALAVKTYMEKEKRWKELVGTKKVRII
jgi:hypothetical protein